VIKHRPFFQYSSIAGILIDVFCVFFLISVGYEVKKIKSTLKYWKKGAGLDP